MARILVGTERTPDRRPVAAASWRVAWGRAWRRVGGKSGKGWDDCLPRSGTPRAGGELVAAGCEDRAVDEREA